MEKLKVRPRKELEVELEDIVDHYNLIFNRSVRSTKGFEENYYEIWSLVHDVERIKKAITNARIDSYWKDKMTLTILFRTKNRVGEPVDYIEDHASVEVPSYQGEIAIN